MNTMSMNIGTNPIKGFEQVSDFFLRCEHGRGNGSLRSSVTSWWDSIKDNVTLHGLAYQYDGDSHDDSYRTFYFISETPGAFAEYFDSVQAYSGTFDLCKKIIETEDCLKMRDAGDYAQMFCSYEGTPFVINPIVRRFSENRPHKDEDKFSVEFFVVRLGFQPTVLKQADGAYSRCIRALGLSRLFMHEYTIKDWFLSYPEKKPDLYKYF